MATWTPGTLRPFQHEVIDVNIAVRKAIGAAIRAAELACGDDYARNHLRECRDLLERAQTAAERAYPVVVFEDGKPASPPDFIEAFGFKR